MVRSLPLRTGFFPTPQLSAADESELLAWGRSLVPEVHRADAEWTLVHEKKGVQLMEDRQKGGLSYSVRGTATVHASLDDLMDLFLGRAATTADFRALMQLQLRETFADAAVLYHREQNESETLGVKWVAMRPKKTAGINLGSSQGHDFCLMEYAGVLSRSVINGPADQQLGVCLYESVDQRECTLLTESHRIERGSITRCGYLFLPIAGGVEAQFVCSVRQPPNQRSTRRLNRAILQTWAESVGALEEAIGRKRISRELTQRRMPNWVSDKDRACCHLCLKTFTNTRRKHHCRACGEIICRACSMYKAVDLQSVGLTTLRVCKACMDGSNAKKSESEASDTRSKTSDALTTKDESLSQSQALALPNGVNDATLRDAVEEYALALPNQSQNGQAPSVPDLVGLAWLRQLAERDPSKKEMVAELMENLRRETEMQFGSPFGGPVGGVSSEQVDIYDTLCDLAAQALACKYAVVSLVDENRQWFKSAVNVQEAEVPRDFSFCEYPVRDQRPLVVMDTLADPRFRHHPFVTGPLSVRFLAGAPLFTVDNQCVGAVCVLDTEPRDSLQESQLATMQNLAHLAMVMVQERREAQARIARAAASQQLVPARNVGYGAANYGGNPSVSTSSDLVPLSSYAGDDRAMVVQTKQPNGPKEDPVLKEQMIQLLHKASQVRDQVTQQSQTNKPAQQQAGLQSSAE